MQIHSPVANTDHYHQLPKLDLSHKNTQNKNFSTSTNTDLQESLPKIGYAISVAGHLLTALVDLTQLFPESLKTQLNQATPIISKAVNSINFFAKGLDAFKHNRAFDAIARFLFPAIVPFMPVEDMYLGAGLGLGLTMINDAQEGRKKRKHNFIDNLKDNIKVFQEMLQETIAGGLGKNKKIFFNSNKEEGHSMQLSGIGMSLGSALGLINKFIIKKLVGEDSIINLAVHKVSTVLRNLFGIWGDVLIMNHPDNNNRNAGVAYISAAILDTLQATVLPKELRSGLSNVVQSLANIANYNYANTSKARSEGKFQNYALSTP